MKYLLRLLIISILIINYLSLNIEGNSIENIFKDINKVKEGFKQKNEEKEEVMEEEEKEREEKEDKEEEKEDEKEKEEVEEKEKEEDEKGEKEEKKEKEEKEEKKEEEQKEEKEEEKEEKKEEEEKEDEKDEKEDEKEEKEDEKEEKKEEEKEKEDEKEDEKDDSKTDRKEAEYGSQITTYTDKIIDGYVEDSNNPANIPLTIGTNPEDNVIKIYYVKRNDLQYTVNYLEKGTNNVIHEAKTGLNKTFQDTIYSQDEIITIYGYDYDSADKSRLIIGANNSENIINLYYTKKEANVVVKYVDVYTNEEISVRTNKQGQVGDNYETTAKEIEGYTLVGNMLPENATGTYTEEEIIVTYYYVKNTKVTSKYIDKITNLPLTEDVVINGHEREEYATEEKRFENYELVEINGNPTGTMTREPITVVYYYIHNSAGVEVNYLDVNTNQALARECRQKINPRGSEQIWIEESLPQIYFDFFRAKQDVCP